MLAARWQGQQGGSCDRRGDADSKLCHQVGEHGDPLSGPALLIDLVVKVKKDQQHARDHVVHILSCEDGCVFKLRPKLGQHPKGDRFDGALKVCTRLDLLVDLVEKVCRRRWRHHGVGLELWGDRVQQVKNCAVDAYEVIPPFGVGEEKLCGRS